MNSVVRENLKLLMITDLKKCPFQFVKTYDVKIPGLSPQYKSAQAKSLFDNRILPDHQLWQILPILVPFALLLNVAGSSLSRARRPVLTSSMFHETKARGAGEASQCMHNRT